MIIDVHFVNRGENIVHLFWDCIHVYTFIAELKTIMLRHIMNNELHFSKAEFILGSHQMKPCQITHLFM